MTKAAILIDGGYFLKRLPHVRPDIDDSNPTDVVRAIGQLVHGHLNQLNDVYQVPNQYQLLYRCFYYDALPYAGKGHTAISEKAINYAHSNAANFRNELFAALRSRPNFALRLGRVDKISGSSWTLKPSSQKRLLNGVLDVSDLTDSDFTPNLLQKGVDMRIGLDIASITLKKQADTIILVSGDSDFAPAARLARREGATFILDPLWQAVLPDLHEHVDMLRSGFYNPKSRAEPSDTP